MFVLKLKMLKRQGTPVECSRIWYKPRLADTWQEENQEDFRTEELVFNTHRITGGATNAT
jgi:hypothetical protein